MREGVIGGSFVATTAAFVWATYYVFVILIDALNPIALFLYPALVGGLLFLAYGLLRRGRIPRPSRTRDYLLPGAGYLASQILILLSTLANGGVLTSTFILLGDTIVSPSIVFALGRNRYRPKLALLSAGLLVLVTSAAVLTLYGGSLGARSAWGMVLLLLIPPSLSLFFVYTNERIMAEGVAEILTPAFLVSSVLILVYVLASGHSSSLSFGGASELVILLLIGATSMFVGYVLFFRASRMTGFTLSSILMALIPPFTLILGVLFLGLTATIATSFLIVLAAVGAVLCTLAFAEGNTPAPGGSGAG